MSITRQVLPKPTGLSGDHADTKDQLALLQRQNASLKSENNALKRTLDDAGLTYELPSDDRRKRPKFNNVHCDQCSKDKKGCWPRDRVWPQKCTRCIQKGLECSEGRKTSSKHGHQPIGLQASVPSVPLGPPPPEGSLSFNIAAEAIRLAAEQDQSSDTGNTDIAKSEAELWKRRVDVALDLHEACMTFGTLLLFCAIDQVEYDLLQTLLEAGVHVEGGILANDIRRYVARKNDDMFYSVVQVWRATVSHKVQYLQGSSLFSCLKQGMDGVLNGYVPSQRPRCDVGCLSRTTPLMNAIKNRDLEAISLLLRSGADPDTAKPRKQIDLASDACDSFFSVLASLVAIKGPVASTATCGNNMLRYTVTQSQRRVAERLCSVNSDHNDRNGDPCSPAKAVDGCDWCRWHMWDVNSTPLLCAVSKDDTAIVQALIGGGCDVDKIGKAGLAPLHSAACHGQKQVATLLLDAHADIDKPSSLGLTSLFCAAERADLNLVALLLEHGALTCLHSNRSGHWSCEAAVKSPLVVAARKGELEIVQLILSQSRRECIDAAKSCTNAALRCAVENGSMDIIQLLIEANAHVGVRNDGEDDLLVLASRQGRKVTVELLLSRLPGFFDLDQALLRANEEGHASIVEILLSSGADIGVRYEDDLSLLDVASQKRRYKNVQLLIRHVRECDKVDWPGRALFLAAQNDDASMVFALLDAGANSTRRDNDGQTPLAIAVKGGYLDIVNFLLEYDAILNDEAELALLLAVRYGRTAIAHRLISHGLSLHIKDTRFHELLLIAAKGYDMDTFCMLRKQGLCIDPEDPESSEVFFNAIDCEDDRWVLELLEAGADPYMTWRRGTEKAGEEEKVSLLRFAIVKSWYPVVKYLLNHNVPCEGFGERSLVRGAIRRRQYATASLLMPRAVAELEAELSNTLQLTRERRLAIQQEVTAYGNWIKSHLSSKAATLPSRGHLSLEALLDKFAFPVERLRILLEWSLHPSDIESLDQTAYRAG